MSRLVPASISAMHIPFPFRDDIAEESLTHNMHEEQRPQVAQPKSKASSSTFPMFFLPPYYERSCSRNTDATVLPQAPHMQSLITAGSRLYGSSSCLDPRTCLGIKIYDFAVYADVEQLRRATTTQQQQLLQQMQQHQQQSPKLPSLLSQDGGGTENGETSIQGEGTHHFLSPRNLLHASKGLLQV
ncbi:hypothetical protein DUNSADRAFT_3142 [Dunaliella salina]|uniref:Encoded protein n=1 Tax=Dunaliella salina TaxID=3046 RepID=A0ABQ7H837_DUNSA|nr:hypothetical protein DUNSADRAFT_3142 [Dunaliella salina]|eukprot:KAF5843013.1 hypothetical protein DUNSADRAFT_3142 [Dunaliella salina]